MVQRTNQNHMKLLALTLTWIFYIQIFVMIHYLTIERYKKTPPHGLSFIAVLIVALRMSYHVYGQTYLFPVCLLYLGLMYWVLFNLELNHFRNKELLHLGDKSFLDRVEASVKSPGATLALKVVIIIMCLFLLIDLK